MPAEAASFLSLFRHFQPFHISFQTVIEGYLLLPLEAAELPGVQEHEGHIAYPSALAASVNKFW